jgi:hypothetical protein
MILVAARMAAMIPWPQGFPDNTVGSAAVSWIQGNDMKGRLLDDHEKIRF